MKSILITFTVISATIMLAAGCDNSTSAAASSIGLVRPGVGTNYVFRRMYWDTLGVLVQDYLDTQVVYRSGISFAGKTNVIVMSSKWDTALRFPSYYNYEPNGDFEDYSAIPGVRQGWRTYPIASKTTSIFAQVDTNYFDSVANRQVHSYREFDFSYVKDSSIVEAGQVLSATDILFRAKNSVSYENFTTDIWISPPAGFQVRSATQISKPYHQNYSRWEFHLISLDLK